MSDILCLVYSPCHLRTGQSLRSWEQWRGEGRGKHWHFWRWSSIGQWVGAGRSREVGPRDSRGPASTCNQRYGASIAINSIHVQHTMHSPPAIIASQRGTKRAARETPTPPVPQAMAEHERRCAACGPHGDALLTRHTFDMSADGNCGGCGVMVHLSESALVMHGHPTLRARCMEINNNTHSPLTRNSTRSQTSVVCALSRVLFVAISADRSLVPLRRRSISNG